MMSSCPLWCNL